MLFVTRNWLWGVKNLRRDHERRIEAAIT